MPKKPDYELKARVISSGKVKEYKKISRAIFASYWLEETGEIGRETAHRYTIVTICNFDKYQVNEEGQGQDKGTERAAKGQRKGTERATPKEIKKERKEEINNLSSLSSSLPESVEESEKEKILKYFFFKNLAAPEKEVEKFLSFNDRWNDMPEVKKTTSLQSWNQIPHQAPRFNADFLRMWSELVEMLPDDIRKCALSDRISYQRGGRYFILKCPEDLKDYIESHIDEVKPILWPFITSNKCEILKYHIY